jgi:hypothetical protein
VGREATERGAGMQVSFLSYLQGFLRAPAGLNIALLLIDPGNKLIKNIEFETYWKQYYRKDCHLPSSSYVPYYY